MRAKLATFVDSGLGGGLCLLGAAALLTATYTLAAKWVGPWWAFLPSAVIFTAIVAIWFWLHAGPVSPVPDEHPYTVVAPNQDLLSVLPALGPKTVPYVQRPETADLGAKPLPCNLLIFEGARAVGKTREAAETVFRLAKSRGQRVVVYLYKSGRLEIPDRPPKDLDQQFPILFLDDLDHPWRGLVTDECLKAARTLQRVREIAAWFAEHSHDRQTCWVLATAWSESVQRVGGDARCKQALSGFHRVLIGPWPEHSAADYWQACCHAFDLRPSSAVIERLVPIWAGGLREPYDYLSAQAAEGHRALRPADVDAFREFQKQRWEHTVAAMPQAQQDLFQAMAALDSVGVPLFREFVVDLAVTRRITPANVGRLEGPHTSPLSSAGEVSGPNPGWWGHLIGGWDRRVLDRQLGSLARQYFRVSEDARLLPHASRLPMVPDKQRTAIAYEVVDHLVSRALDRRLASRDITRLRDALAAADGALYGSDLLRALYLINRTRAALSLPRPQQRITEVRKRLAEVAAVPLALTEADGEPWPGWQLSLGNAYADLPTGDRAENLHRAIECYEAALQVYTEADSPVDWAKTQNNLGNAYRDLPTGDSGASRQRAIECYQAALRVFTETDFPLRWAQTQVNLGLTYWRLPSGDRGANLESAIGCYQAASRVLNETDFPVDWASAQNDLGLAYWNLTTGDRGRNLQRAIECFQAALRIRTETDFPADWATTLSNLGIAYAESPTGDRAENLKRAIECYEATLRVRTRADLPADWAVTQNNLATDYADLPTGDRGANVRRAIEHYEAALTVWTEEAFPEYWRLVCNDLAPLYEEVGRLEEAAALRARLTEGQGA